MNNDARNLLLDFYLHRGDGWRSRRWRLGAIGAICLALAVGVWLLI